MYYRPSPSGGYWEVHEFHRDGYRYEIVGRNATWHARIWESEPAIPNTCWISSNFTSQEEAKAAVTELLDLPPNEGGTIFAAPTMHCDRRQFEFHCLPDAEQLPPDVHCPEYWRNREDHSISWNGALQKPATVIENLPRLGPTDQSKYMQGCYPCHQLPLHLQLRLSDEQISQRWQAITDLEEEAETAQKAAQKKLKKQADQLLEEIRWELVATAELRKDALIASHFFQLLHPQPEEVPPLIVILRNLGFIDTVGMTDVNPLALIPPTPHPPV